MIVSGPFAYSRHTDSGPGASESRDIFWASQMPISQRFLGMGNSEMARGLKQLLTIALFGYFFLFLFF